jgi:hypothetical protein
MQFGSQFIVACDRVVTPGGWQALSGERRLQRDSAVGCAPNRDGLIEALAGKAGTRIEKVLHFDAASRIRSQIVMQLQAVPAIRIREDNQALASRAGSREYDPFVFRDALHELEAKRRATPFGQIRCRCHGNDVAVDQQRPSREM